MKNFGSWRGFPNSIRNLIIKQTLCKSSRQKQLDQSNDTIYFYLNFYYSGEQFAQSCIEKLKKNIRKVVKFVVLYNTTKAYLQIQNISIIPLLTAKV